MKSILASVLTCVVLFGISLGATQYLFPTTPGEPDPTAQTGESESEPMSETKKQKLVSTSLPAGVHPDNSVSIESVLQMTDSIRKMEQQLVEREKQVAKKEQRIQILFEDLSAEQSELRAFSEGIDAKVEMLSRMTIELESKLEALDQRKRELETLAKQTGSDESSKQAEFDSRVSEVKDWFANLEPEQAADYLREFANTGKIEFASALLREMQARQQSKILTAMNDPVLVDQLIDALKVRKPGDN